MKRVTLFIQIGKDRIGLKNEWEDYNLCRGPLGAKVGYTSYLYMAGHCFSVILLLLICKNSSVDYWDFLGLVGWKKG